MARFVGSDEATVDEKGRFPLPVKFRRKLEKVEGCEFMLQPGLEGDISATPVECFDALDEKRSRLDPLNENDRLAAHVYGEMEPCALDKAGRLMVPPRMRRQFGIEGTIVVSGSGDWLSIWNKAVFENRTIVERQRALAASSQRKLRATDPETEA